MQALIQNVLSRIESEYYKSNLHYPGMQSGTIDSASPWGLSLKEKLLPQYLKEMGYETHAIGKVSDVFSFPSNKDKDKESALINILFFWWFFNA